MRRLEYLRRTRSAPGRARNATEAVLVLAHVTRERHRLQQERAGLEKRLRGIEVRLAELTVTETRLAPALQMQLDRLTAGTAVREPVAPLPAGVGEVTLQY